MNMNQLVNMVVRMVVQRGMNAVMRRGMNMASRGLNRPGAADAGRRAVEADTEREAERRDT